MSSIVTSEGEVPLKVRFRRHPHDAREGSAHVTVQVFAGYWDGSLGNCGDIVMRAGEWDDLRNHLSDGDFDRDGLIVGLTE